MARESIYSALMDIKDVLADNGWSGGGSGGGSGGSDSSGSGTLILECVRADDNAIYRSGEGLGCGFYFITPEPYSVDRIYDEFAAGKRILFHCDITNEMIAAVAEEGDSFGATSTYLTLDGIIRNEYADGEGHDPFYTLSVSAFKGTRLDTDICHSGDPVELLVFTNAETVN